MATTVTVEKSKSVYAIVERRGFDSTVLAMVPIGIDKAETIATKIADCLRASA